MVNGYVNTESNYFMDSRLNLLNQRTYNMKNVAATATMTTSSTLDPAGAESGQFYDPSMLLAHNLMDILRVYYEFGPMVCGLVNLIDFVPRFYSPTLISSEPAKQEPAEQPTSGDGAGPSSRATSGEQLPLARQKIPSTESLTRLIRRSLAWFEAERKQVLAGTQNARRLDHSPDSPVLAPVTPVNLKVCNLQVHHKTLLKSQLVQIEPSNALASVGTRTMAHQSVATTQPLTCAECSISTAAQQSQDWCSHILDLSQVYQVKFVRLAYVVPVYNKYVRPVNSLRSLRVGRKQRHSAASSESQLSLSSKLANPSPLLEDHPSSSSSSPSSSSSISSSSSQSSTPNVSPSLKKQNSSPSIKFDQEQPVELAEHEPSGSVPAEKATDADEECTKQAALEIVRGTNSRHQTDEEAHQMGLGDDKLNDSHIGQLTYRLFAPCQLVNSSSCFSINPVNSSSPLARRGSMDLNGSRISSENAHPSTSLLGSSSSNQYSEAQQIVTSFGAFFPALSHDMVAGSSESTSKAQSTSASRFTTNEFEPVEAIRRRMEVYVTTNSMKVIAGETLIVNLSDIFSCLSTAIEQTVVRVSFSAQAKPTTWVNVYVLYAAVEEPQLPGQLLAQQKLQELALIEENHEEEARPSSEQLEKIFDDDFDGDARASPSSNEQQQQQQQVPTTSAIKIEQNPVDSTLTLYNSAYDRTVALPTQPENHLYNLDPIDFLGSDTDCLWMNEADLLEAQLKQYQQVDHRGKARKKSRAGKGRSHEDSQCSIM